MKVGRTIPWKKALRRGLQILSQGAAQSSRHSFARAMQTDEEFQGRGPLVVSGLLSETKGISQGARLTLTGLRHAGFKPLEHEVRQLLSCAPGSKRSFPANEAGGVWVSHINAPEAEHVLAVLDPRTWRGRYRIGFWAWELPLAPRAWVESSRAFHEIWTPSTFVANSMLAAGVKIPVRVTPHPVALDPPRAAPSRPKFGLPSDSLCVLALGDLNSSFARKNLIGAIEIYKRAFPTSGSARLVVKTQAAREHPNFKRHAIDAAGGRNDIILVEGELSLAEAQALMASCDIVLSPHRAEGFGLSLAEAIMMGRPVLATGWSGNMDFMSDATAGLIEYKLVPVDDPAGIYMHPDQLWAEPLLEDGARKLRALVDSHELRDGIVSACRKALQRQSQLWMPGSEIGSSLISRVDQARIVARPASEKSN